VVLPTNLDISVFADRVEVRSPPDPGPAYAVIAWYDVDQARPTKVALETPDGITPSMLQRFAWGQHLTVADLIWRQHQAKPGPFPVASDDLLAAVGDVMGVDRPKGTPGRKGHPDDFFRGVADRYLLAMRSGDRSPTMTIARELADGNRNTAAGWVRRSRELGLLPPARPGRAG